MTDPKPGIYRHYKGQDYAVLGCGKHTETGEELVLYQAQYGNRETWIRPKSMFLEDVTIDGVTRPRFKFIAGFLQN